MSDLAAAFESRFGRSPAAVIDAPGRINIVGEHTDYSSLPVLPLAIQHRVRVAVAPRDDEVLEADSLRLPGTFHSSEGEPPGWGRYLASVARAMGAGRGASMLIGGDLPASGGLSSSSALTLAVIAAVSRARGESPTDTALIATAVAAERGTGVEGGTMDQTVIVHARAGHALRIDFAPAGMRHVPVPADIVLVAGYSGVAALKSSEAKDGYNARVVGCRCAASVLAARANRDMVTPTLGQVADLDPQDIPEWATAREAAAIAGCDEATLVDLTVGTFDADRPLPIRAFARHVLTEAKRVDAAECALHGADGAALGAILDASHRSLAIDFQVSTPGLEQLTRAARLAGACGARLTGAGFGGWAVAVTTPAATAAVLEAMKAVAGQSFVALPSAGMR